MPWCGGRRVVAASRDHCGSALLADRIIAADLGRIRDRGSGVYNDSIPTVPIVIGIITNALSHSTVRNKIRQAFLRSGDDDLVLMLGTLGVAEIPSFLRYSKH